ncbi:MarR family winged helix-turn-helix transcriptional regulator [Azorhizobium doebereinerae]|uniref:MarR family winged helix-turn-helix transcriptional regulator n=1 Tax=Azorhizobium doebereinerae TaxID=281091 RepID=UPI000421B3BA|nr:MarR family transcriptional regulator [Azorhizobium doebereinerae]
MTYETTASASPGASAFGQLVMQVNRLWRRELDHALAVHGLSQATALPLLMLSRRDCQRQGTLAEELGIEGPSLVRLIDMLAAEHLVERREDPADRRAKTLHVTPAGRRKAAEIETIVQGVRSRLLGDVAAADLAVALEVLRTVEARLHREAEARRPGAERGAPGAERGGQAA